METLPNPREEPAFRKEGGLSWFLRYVCIRLASPRLRNEEFFPSLFPTSQKGCLLRVATMTEGQGSATVSKLEIECPASSLVPFSGRGLIGLSLRERFHPPDPGRAGTRPFPMRAPPLRFGAVHEVDRRHL